MKSIQTLPYKKIGIAIITCLAMLLFVTQFVHAAGKNDPKANTISWGNSRWILANDGELVYDEGDIGNAPALSDSLKNDGIEPKAVRSIEFTGETHANDILNMFSGLPNLEKVIGMNKLHYAGSAQKMFFEDSSLKDINMQGFDTSKIIDMSFMFMKTGVESLDLSGMDNGKVRSMFEMFDSAEKLKTVNLKNFHTPSVTDMRYMFHNTSVNNLDFSSFDTSNVDNFEGMFDDTPKLTKLDLSSFNTARVTTMENMFSGAGVEQLDISSFTIGDINTTKMFDGASKLKQLTLGKQTQLNTSMNIPEAPTNNIYNGHWQNVGSGTVDNPTGDHVWTSAELMSQFKAATMGDDTFVWQKNDPSNINIAGESSDYASDPDLTKYVSTAVKPLHPYRYNAVVDNSFGFYPEIKNGQSETDNKADLGDKTGSTVYAQAEMPVTYTEGTKDGQKTKFIKVSFDGNQWYWVDQHALNLDLKSRYPSVNGSGIALIDDQFLGTTNTFGVISGDFNSQMIDNAYNPDGQIIYQSFAKESDFTDAKDPTQALKAFNDNLDRAAKSWNDVLGRTVLIKATDTDKKITLRVVANPHSAGSATLSGNTGIDNTLTEYALDPNAENYATNALFITMRHELGHSLGLNHTSNGQYYGMPDGYALSIYDDVMNAVLLVDDDYNTYSQRTITSEDVDAVKLILANHNFENPQPQTKKVVTNERVDRVIFKS